MTASTSTTPSAPAPRLGALVGSEFLRARSRRSVLWLPLLAVLAVAGTAAIMWFSTAHLTQERLDSAAQSFLAEQQLYYDQCIADTDLSEAERDEFCWQPSAEDARSNAIWSLDRRPFDQGALEGLLVLGGGIGLLAALLLAATTGAADWGARTMGLLLSWEPRRTRVFAVRLAVAMTIGLVVEALLVVLALGLGAVIAGSHGIDPSVPSSALGDSYAAADLGAGLQRALRGLPLGALAAAGSFSVAMLTRSTGWAIGASIGFVTIVETVVRPLWPWATQWLIQTNLAAWLTGGSTVMVDPGAAQLDNTFAPEVEVESVPAGFLLITDTRALATLTVIAATGVVLGWITFRRGDVE
mgnify:CR=1 FL=1